MSKKMKILIIPSWYPSKENPIWGSYFIKQAESLSLYADVSMLYIDRIGIKRIHTILNAKKSDGLNKKLYSFNFYKKTILNAKFISIDLAFKLYCRGIYKAYKEYIKVIGKPDIILAQSILPAGIGANYLSNKTNIPFVVHAHSLNVMSDINFKKYIDKIIKNADGYMSVSKVIQNSLEEFGRKDVKIIPNFINTKRFNIKRIKSSKEFVLINICNFFKVKALEVLIKAMDIVVNEKKIKDIKLRIIGTGEYEEYYKSVANNLNLNEYVEFVGFVKNDLIPNIMSKSDVVCVSSRSETFCIPIVEGMSAGLPCITTDCGGPTEIINDHIGIIVPIDDSEKYAEAIISMKKNYSKYDKEYIKKYAHDNYDESVVCNKIISNLKAIIENKKAV